MAEATINPDDRGRAGATAATADTAAPHPSAKANRGSVRSLAASTTGQLFEWYEWTAYAVFAPYIAAVMFNNENPVSALLATFAVFAVGFLMRPLGGIVFGRIADVRGRKFVLITTMLMMAGASLLIGLLPSYETLGIFASALLLLCRMIQGFAHGGESATAYSYVAEIAPPHRRGMWGSLVFVAIMGGTVIAYGIGGGITAVLSEPAVGEWGWRVPFLLGAVFALFVLYLRSGMEESDIFDKAAAAAAADPTSPVATFSRRKLAGAIALVVAMVSGVTVAHYTWSSYASTFAITQRDMDSEAAFWAIFGSQLIALCTLPLWGLLARRHDPGRGRRLDPVLLHVGGVPHQDAHGGHRVRVLPVRRGVRRQCAVPQRPVHPVGPVLDDQRLHHRPVRGDDGRDRLHEGDPGSRPAPCRPQLSVGHN